MTGPDRAVRLTHRLTPDDVERIVDALDVDGLYVAEETPDPDTPFYPVPLARITAALCGGDEQDYQP